MMHYPILSRMRFDILAIPTSTVASEATFSNGMRVIDAYHSSLSLNTLQTLLCGGNWHQRLYRVSKKMKVRWILLCNIQIKIN